jgi:hypothetical protein
LLYYDLRAPVTGRFICAAFYYGTFAMLAALSILRFYYGHSQHWPLYLWLTHFTTDIRGAR